MNKFITTYKWISLPVVLCSATVLSTATFALPTSSQQYQDAQQTSRISQQYVGGNTQIGAGITDQGNVDLELRLVHAKNASELSKKLQIDSTLLKSNINLAFRYLDLEKGFLYKETNLKNLKLATKLNDSTSIASVNYGLGYYYANNAKIDSAYYY